MPNGTGRTKGSVMETKTSVLAFLGMDRIDLDVMGKTYSLNMGRIPADKVAGIIKGCFIMGAKKAIRDGSADMKGKSDAEKAKAHRERFDALQSGDYSFGTYGPRRSPEETIGLELLRASWLAKPGATVTAWNEMVAGAKGDHRAVYIALSTAANGSPPTEAKVKAALDALAGAVAAEIARRKAQGPVVSL